MGNQISQQLTTFLQSILLGTAFGVTYDVLRPFRLRLPRFGAVLDGGYCLAAGAAAFVFLLSRGDGELRAFMVLGAAGGAVLYFCGVSPALRAVWEFWADAALFFAGLLALPMIWMRKILKKTWFYGKRLFYFGRKSYIIIKTGFIWASRKGGGGHGRQKTHGKKAPPQGRSSH